MKAVICDSHDFFKDKRFMHGYKPDKAYLDDLDLNILQFNTIKEALVYLEKRLNDVGFKSFYKRFNYDPGNWIEVDFGSHYAFYYLFDLTKKEWKEFLDD